MALHSTLTKPPIQFGTPARDIQFESERYTVHGALGRGGMALVYEAHDKLLDRRVALKRLQTLGTPHKQQRNVELFEREFHTLAQLAHPRVVQVYDFGIEPNGAFYTMELLDGGDLQQLAPMPWQKACILARDVCSALSLLHSRRLVHRDLSPRNVRCTADGRAKLIDFGAVSPMGASKMLVGTPPCCPPESLHLQALDGRTDLYSLGATLYYMLVGQHAYTAREFSFLHAAWQAGLAPPSEMVAGIPEALDALVSDLLRLEPDARPANAAEVMQRLSAIDGGSPTELLQVTEAYLSTPTLVGREESLTRVSRRLRRSVAGSGRSMMIEGPSGVGRSRFLDACLLEATLLGGAILRADADDAASGEYGVVRALVRQLLTTVPKAALDTAKPLLSLLGHAVPELLVDVGTDALEIVNDSQRLRSRLQLALREWLQNLSQQHSLVIAIDDIDRADEPSAALLAVLATQGAEHAVCLLASAATGSWWVSGVARKLLLESSTRIPLEVLTLQQSEQLLQSLFGRVPNVSLVAHRAQALCSGNPRDLMQFARHLVDRGIARYEAGAWSLPAQLDDIDLPSSLAQALQARVDGLGESARELAHALALCPDQSFSCDECVSLSGSKQPNSVRSDIDELLRADIVRRIEDLVGLSQSAWIPLLSSQPPTARERTLHARIAGVLGARPGQEFRTGQHWLCAGEQTRALDILVPYTEEMMERSSGESVAAATLRAPNPKWAEIYDQALRACDELGRPSRHRFALLSRIVSLKSLFGIHDNVYLPDLLAQLRTYSGLDDWAALDGSLDPASRLKLALQSAQSRYDATPERDRVIAPGPAIRHLSGAIFSALGFIGPAMDLAYLRALPSLLPFLPLVPALAPISKLMDGLAARLTGRLTHAHRIYCELLALVTRADHAGLNANHAEYIRLAVLNGIALLEASSGMESCLERAAQVEVNPVYEVNAVMIRRLHALFQGDIDRADGCKEKVDCLRVQNNARQMSEGFHLIWEVDAHAICEDLTRLRHTIDEIIPIAKHAPGWKPVVLYAAAEHHRIRRATDKALVEIEAALELAAPGEHQLWSSIARCHVHVLHDLGRDDGALVLADEYVAQARIKLGYVPDYMELIHSLVSARVGRTEAAASADSVLERLRSRGISGLNLGLAHEMRARIALFLQDGEGFSQHLEACRVIYCANRNPALSGKYHRLRQAGRARQYAAGLRSTATPDSEVYTASRIGAALEHCRDASQRAKLALTIMVVQSGAYAGFLFNVSEHRPECVAQIGSLAPSEALLTRVQAYLLEQMMASDTTCTDSNVENDVEAPEWMEESGERYRPLLLSHNSDGSHVVTGLALLAVLPGKQFSYPAQIATEISRFSAHSGDSSLLVIVD